MTEEISKEEYSRMVDDCIAEAEKTMRPIKLTEWEKYKCDLLRRGDKTKYPFGWMMSDNYVFKTPKGKYIIL